MYFVVPFAFLFVLHVLTFKLSALRCIHFYNFSLIGVKDTRVVVSDLP